MCSNDSLRTGPRGERTFGAGYFPGWFPIAILRILRVHHPRGKSWRVILRRACNRLSKRSFCGDREIEGGL